MFTFESTNAIRGLAASVVLTACLFGVGSTEAGEPNNVPERVDYAKDVKPIFEARCFACHGALKQNGGLRLDSVAAMKKGGESGAALVAGDGARSLLIKAVAGSDGLRMPPEDQGELLEPRQVELLKLWIDQGASGPADEKPQPSPADHWAFKRPLRPPVPVVKNAGRIVNAIDAFVAAGHEEMRLTPTVVADKSVLLRRLYLDLIGLPPTRDQLHEFLADDSPDAYDKVVDRLLAAPQYGERWGRHWMDVWRYSDWYGNEGGNITNGQPHIWRWRDWIVESLNQDKGYDRMILEMLAGDELAPSDPQVLRATGYLARNHFRLDANVPPTMSVEHSSRAFLGLTLECCRCHDHKYDPISQREFYRFRAFFEPMGSRVDRVPGQANILADGLARVYDAKPEAPTFVYIKGDERRPDKNHPLTAGVPEFFEQLVSDGKPMAFAEVRLSPEESYPALRPHYGRDEREYLGAQVREKEIALEKSAKGVSPAAPQQILGERELATLRAKQIALEACLVADRAKYRGAPAVEANRLAVEAGTAQRAVAIAQAEESIAREDRRIADATVKLKTDPSQAAQLATYEKNRDRYRKALDAAKELKPGSKYAPLGELYPNKSSGRRSALARWLTDDRNPLTARVAVNHIWMRHFGRPLVPTVFDFGHAGKPPTHPEMLDWLAVEFVESGWSMKHLHRLLVTSRTYRLSSSNAGRAAESAIDPDNNFLWRMNPRRMEGELVRDGLLHIAGRLDLKQGGADIPADRGDQIFRRSIYFNHSGINQLEILRIFDGAGVAECYRRRESIVPQQALALTNSPLASTTAELAALRLADGDDADFIVAAFETVLGRMPSMVEQSECALFLNDPAHSVRAGKPTRLESGETDPPSSDDARRRARESLLHVLLNHNDFVTIR